MRSLITLVVGALVLLSASACSEQPETADPVVEWIDLFDGESLDGWTPKIRGEAYGEDRRGTFRVEDGAITVSYENYEGFDDEFGHLFYESPFSDYHLTYEYRFFGDQVEGGPGWAYRNSGIMIHSPPGESMLAAQDFPISIEVQLLGGNGTDERTTANLCTPGTNVVMGGQLETRHCISSTSQTYHGDDWVSGEIVVHGDSLVTHIIEGEVVLQYAQPQMGGGSVDGHDPAFKVDGTLLDGGYLSLQSESHPVQFRNLRLKQLDR